MSFGASHVENETWFISSFTLAHYAKDCNMFPRRSHVKTESGEQFVYHAAVVDNTNRSSGARVVLVVVVDA